MWLRQRSAGVTAVIDTERYDSTQVLSDPVEHAIRATAREPGSIKVIAQRLAYTVGLSSSAVATKSISAAATASGGSSVVARRADGVRTVP